MPIYEYQSVVTGCDYCEQGFEAVQSVNAANLVQCPKCGGPIKRVISSFSVTRSERDLLSPKNIAQKGFTQYKKRGDGVYEKTAGKGPNVIKKDA